MQSESQYEIVSDYSVLHLFNLPKKANVFDFRLATKCQMLNLLILTVYMLVERLEYGIVWVPLMHPFVFLSISPNSCFKKLILLHLFPFFYLCVVRQTRCLKRGHRNRSRKLHCHKFLKRSGQFPPFSNIPWSSSTSAVIILLGQSVRIKLLPNHQRGNMWWHLLGKETENARYLVSANRVI